MELIPAMKPKFPHPLKLSVEYRATVSLNPSERNARTHSPQQIQQLTRSITEFGWTNPILIDEHNAIVAGHGRLAAAQALGMAEVPTITLIGLTDAQKRALAIADNKLALNAGWDEDMLTLELSELKGLDFDLSLIGFSDEELAGILDTTEGLTDPDDTPDVQAEAVAQILVNLGLVHRDGEWVPYWDGWISWMRVAGWRRFGWYVWDQGPGLPGDWNGRLAPSHEWVFHFNREAERARKTKESKHAGEIHRGKGLRNKNGVVGTSTVYGKAYQDTKIPDSVIRVMRQKGGLKGNVGSHPAVFPVDLPGEFINAFSDPDDLVYEPFTGSGTQLIAAQKNGRSCYGCEIAPQYVDVAVRRWQQFTGQEATLDGRTFAEVEAERGDIAA